MTLRLFSLNLLALPALALAACSQEAGDGPSGQSSATPAVDAQPATVPPASIGEPQAGAISTAAAATTDDPCGASKVAPYIGREATVPVRTEVARISGAKSDRWIYPDSIVTQDLRMDRLNVIMEKGTDRIVEARCG